ncbi:MAG: methylmalonyl-CoA epimerase [Candidatus Marinimicrobia bacterium]|jgi:methylmalonyl-CoA/ethylmalonyl-CoA epimerase|nr:methylmalonyl-CoA epimerase [Candidatus Neomarinimicrobiota bacterium]MBT3502291.1 methylmalonyl-CoA epimerase [Candidatus Neomarinimicrobiota bacterium]MBT3840369.1 methylmalonyl-CoA epimerase [Candidatus Neomarinimicrobiota bacterium]MBT3998511.1 methylmalonyl-CoA epimerase [Candidatus Neomarinimicrobiota bacterium]MBT4578973.1 methylmalonyl-CoA epimerase [Candidatus Neomarinimicrobiota bacterium]
MKILGIEHIGIAVNDLANDSPFWNHILNIKHHSTETVESQGVTTDIYDTQKGKVELLESLKPDSPISKFIDKKGSGIHHVCFEVDDITNAIKELKENNIQVLTDKYLIGAEGFKVVFIHPKSTGGVLVELAEKP